jgi:hypothetical protein
MVSRPPSDRRGGSGEDLLRLLGEETALGRPLAIARRAVTGPKAAITAPRYLGALERALADEFPPFAAEAYARLFRSAAQSGQWLVIWLIRAAEEEGQRARRLWGQAARGNGEARSLKRHAVDESNHVLAYLTLLDVAFPGAVPATFRAELEQLSPRYTMRRKVAADGGAAAELDVAGWIHTNLSEVRTAVRHVFLRAALSAHCPERRFARVAAVLDSLLGDELRHIGYSAEIIEQKLAGEGARTVTAALLRGMREHIRATCEDALDYQYNVRFGNYP